MTPRETDPALRRLERRSIWACLALALVALLVQGGRPEAAIGVLGGGLLAGASYWAIKSSVDRFTGRTGRGRGAGEARGRKAALMVATGLFVVRYALLVLGAYVMIARLRLHPVGLIVGASSVVAAAAIDAMRTSRT